MITFARYLLLLLALAVLPSAWTLTVGAQSRIAPAGSTTANISGADGAIEDGASATTADVLDLTTYNGLATVILDANGDQITSFGGGTQYTEADTDASIAGTAMLMEGAANALVPAQGTAADGLLVNLGANNDVVVTNAGTFAVQAAQSGTWDEVGINDSGNSITVDGTVTVTDGAGALNVIVDSGAVTVSDGAGALNVICDSGCSGGTQYAEDAIAATGDTGTLALVVRQDAQSDFAADGDYVPLSVDADGGLRVSIVAGAGSGGTALADDADFTAGTTSFTPFGGFYQSTVTACTDGDTCAAGITTGRALKVAISDAAGALLSLASDATEDAAASGGEGGPMVLTVRRDTAASSAGTDGDFATLNTTSTGRLWVDASGVSLTVASHAVTNAGTFAVQVDGNALTALQLIDNVVGTEDAAETAGGGLAMAGAVVRSTAAGSSATAGDNATLNVDTLGRLWTTNGGPCADPARITHAAISESTAATNEIVALNGSDLIYVCSYKWVVGGASTLKWVRGTGSDCGTGTTDIEGAQSYAANGGVTEQGGGAPLFAVAAGNALCLTAGSAVAQGGRVSYVRTAAP